MELWEALADSFRYDDWANKLWLECLLRKDAVDPDHAIFAHILAARKMSLMRCSRESPTGMPVVALTAEAIEETTAGWLSLLANLQDDPVIEIRRPTGEEFRLRLSEIAMHAVNHGTYHRGELRGLCRTRGDDDFPETDRMRYSIFKTA